MDLQKADSKEYLDFIEKFAPKTTTDDCFTPPLVYDAVRDWVCKEYGVDKDKIVRPFYPGGDYQNFDYSNGAVVVDNPPFSILSKICTFYLDKGIPFFLFAPALTSFSCKNTVMRMCHIACDVQITYANGAVVNTGFVTNLFGDDIIAMTAPGLGMAIQEANNAELGRKKKLRKTHTLAGNVLTAARLGKYSKRGITFKVRRSECIPVSRLDAGVGIFGGGLLLSNCAAKRLAAAEEYSSRTAQIAEAVELSERELNIVRGIDGGDFCI